MSDYIGKFFPGINLKQWHENGEEVPEIKVCYRDEKGGHRTGILSEKSEITPTVDDGSRWRFREVFELGKAKKSNTTYTLVDPVEMVDASVPLGPAPIPVTATEAVDALGTTFKVAKSQKRTGQKKAHKAAAETAAA